jgi:hypothetical protein
MDFDEGADFSFGREEDPEDLKEHKKEGWKKDLSFDTQGEHCLSSK